ncbi:DUF3373 domain-containing protein [Campylobacter sp. MIT 99-7217]|uniref:DUF3373 family protein n=1 Tax=Campylobacter sp. MIT 99-7217 TaxID=535091 RepID=UPI001159AA24|nr:DUF3373 family protein [Campylobacter sp. MIT 99-7217]TQR29370.1 DUF3373 domain-containing protein [Campylobacter sp. MIT 99-7217]
MKAKMPLMLASCLVASSLYAVPTDADIKKLQAQVDELNERLDETEFQSTLDKIKFKLDFSTGVSNTYLKGIGDADKAQALNKWAGELNLDMNANINEYTKFYGRLSMAKNWGQMGIQYKNRPLDIDTGRNLSTSGAALYVSRAYVDLSFTPELIATIGRQPGTEGPGSNLRNNSLRQATYPALIVNTLGDAVFLTYKPEFLKEYSFAARAGYGRIYQWDEEGQVRDWISDSGDVADSDLYYVSVEGKVPYIDSIGFDNNLLILSYARLQNFSLPVDNNQINAFIGGAGVKNLGNSDLINLHFESYNIGGSGFNYFGSLGYYKGSNANTDFIILPSSHPAYQTVKNAVSFNEKNGYSVHVGGRYDFSQAFKLGAEYFYGSRFWYTMSRPSFNDPLNLRMTRGHAGDLYAIYQYDKNQFFRLSYTYIKNLWGNRGTPLGGAPGKGKAASGWNENTAQNIMLMYNVKF